VLVHNVCVCSPTGSGPLECVGTGGHVGESDVEEASGMVGGVVGGRWVGSG
jgi:hypothetical protein